MKQKILLLALAGMGIGLAGASSPSSTASPANTSVSDGRAAYEAGRCGDALKALAPAAESGDADAQAALGDVYLDDKGRCDDKGSDKQAAERWFLRAANAGNVEAQRRLIGMHEFDSEPERAAQATAWMAKVAALGGSADLASLAGRYQRAEGVAHDRVLAHAFSLLASRMLEKDDGGQLAGALERGAAEMSPEQQAEAETLAAAWKVGTSLPEASATGRRDPRDWYKAAAEAGDLEAAHKAGTLYWQGGYGLSQEPDLAAFWLRKAAQGGIADAQYQLSQMYAMGFGLPKDYVLAYALHTLAIKGGSRQAAERKDAWDDVLTARQLGEAKALLAKWKKGDVLPQASRYGMQRKVNHVDDAYGKLAPTPEVLSLFRAASEGDEAEFSRLLARVENINDYLVEGEKLLHALLLPAASLRAEAAAWREARNDVRDFAHWQAQQDRHAALQPAKTRMLALALQRGAVFSEGAGRNRAAPLHLAAMFGTPEMVGLLIRHGADPRQLGGEGMSTAPLEYALDQKEHALGLPELITPAQRTANIMALLQAGASRPYIRYDSRASRRKGGLEKLKRPIADYLLWPNVLALTEGTAVLDALLKTGTRPVDDEDGKSLFGYAAEAGNADAIAWLKKRVPRYGAQQRDRWLDAAMLGMYSRARGRDSVLKQLLVKGMKWEQEGPQDGSTGRVFRSLYGGSEQLENGTLLNHATRARRLEWLPALAALGAPVATGGSERDLTSAVQANDAVLVKALLAQGADPLNGPEAALSLALAAPQGDDAVLDLLLDHVVRVQKKSLAALPQPPLEAVLTHRKGISLARVRKLLEAGASARELDAQAIEAAFSAPDRSLAALLIRHGLLDGPAGAANEAASAGANAAADLAAKPYLLFFAIAARRADLLPAILARGEDPNRRNTLRDGKLQPNAVDYAISQGDSESLQVLLAHGGTIDTSTVQPWGTALDRAVFSLDAAMLRMVSKDFSLPLKQACLASPLHLAKVVLESPARYWSLLREHGFAAAGACPGIQERLVRHLAETPDVLLHGWVGQQLVERLQQLAPRREHFGERCKPCWPPPAGKPRWPRRHRLSRRRPHRCWTRRRTIPCAPASQGTIT